MIVILIVLITFKNYVTGYFKKIDSEIQVLKRKLSEAPIEPSKVVKAAVARSQEKASEEKAREDKWESSFKRMDDPLVLLKGEENVSDEKVDLEPPIPEEQIAGSVSIKANIQPKNIPAPKPSFFERNPDLEKFIGENLVSKIGIAILVLAIGFFVKFAIDNNWIGPVARVGIGLLCGGILVFLAHKLRKNYQAFSSVLVGGGLAVFYFTITLAYHQFHLFSQTMAFAIMIVITIFAVVLSILYDRQELAIIALVGGFSAPFLVSDGSGNYKILFTYLIVLNTGLLIIAYNKAWRLMNLLAFIFTIILFAGWLVSLSYDTSVAVYGNALIFAAIFYLLFFFINIANNIKANKKFTAADFSILLANTGLFFATGLYSFAEMNKTEYQGLFTILLGVFNLVASYFLFRKREVDKNILYLFIGITLTFISLTAPIQLHGNNITLFWASETVLLYWLFQKSKINIIQYASLIVWFAMLISLLMDWNTIYSDAGNAITIIANKGFITGVYAAIASYVLFILRNKEKSEKNFIDKMISKNVFRIAGVVLLFITGALEVNFQCKHFYPQTAMNTLYLQLYTFAFVLLLLFVNNKIATIRISSRLQTALLSGCLLFYLFSLGVITGLQKDLLLAHKFLSHFYSFWIVAILVSIIFYKLMKVSRDENSIAPVSPVAFAWIICAGIVIFLSFETFWIANRLFYTDQNSFDEIQKVFIKTCLPILWGVCSFCFMWMGMKYKFKPLRIISLVLFLVTLLKLFIFDISNIPAAGKIAAFFCLGVLLLIVSFMYQRLKNLIIRDEENKPV
ncbi:MAG TPA: DUF2339 domain-containing protein [Chitinophagaceae bacterium]|nr:DUF2339 domain-containing protein [Chitinophagaceae bacterium]